MATLADARIEKQRIMLRYHGVTVKLESTVAFGWLLRIHDVWPSEQKGTDALALLSAGDGEGENSRAETRGWSGAYEIAQTQTAYPD